MNKEEFVHFLKVGVRDAAIDDVVDVLVNPPGRRPRAALVEMSNWYNSQSPEDQAMLRRVIADSVDMALFSTLCVLDGVRAMEDPEDRGELELLHVKGSVRNKLNDPEEEYLHDIFQGMTQDEK